MLIEKTCYIAELRIHVERCYGCARRFDNPSTVFFPLNMRDHINDIVVCCFLTNLDVPLVENWCLCMHGTA